jgi:hypothetical protein
MNLTKTVFSESTYFGIIYFLKTTFFGSKSVHFLPVQKKNQKKIDFFLYSSNSF